MNKTSISVASEAVLRKLKARIFLSSEAPTSGTLDVQDTVLEGNRLSLPTDWPAPTAHDPRTKCLGIEQGEFCISERMPQLYFATKGRYNHLHFKECFCALYKELDTIYIARYIMCVATHSPPEAAAAALSRKKSVEEKDTAALPHRDTADPVAARPFGFPAPPPG